MSWFVDSFIDDERVKAAMARVPRARFVPKHLSLEAGLDQALPIGHGQTISQPSLVGLMTALARVDETSRVLEVGTGSGYQTAILAELAGEVFSIERLEALSSRAAEVLGRLGYRNVRLMVGDGTRGWPDAAPFDAIVVTAAPTTIPGALREQLKVGGRLVIPVGTARFQELMVVTRTEDGFHEHPVTPVLFVPLVSNNDDASAEQ